MPPQAPEKSDVAGCPRGNCFGTYTARLTPRGVAWLAWPGTELPAGAATAAAPGWAASRAAARLRQQVELQLRAYHAGKLKRFTLPVDLSGQTAFRVKVWRTLARIPWGRVLTYGELARRIRKPGAARAVGQACGANLVPVIIPCHRVVAASGGLGGFGGGLDNKRRLLALEGVSL